MTTQAKAKITKAILAALEVRSGSDGEGGGKDTLPSFAYRFKSRSPRMNERTSGRVEPPVEWESPTGDHKVHTCVPTIGRRVHSPAPPPPLFLYRLIRRFVSLCTEGGSRDVCAMRCEQIVLIRRDTAVGCVGLGEDRRVFLRIDSEMTIFQTINCCDNIVTNR